MEKLNRVVVAKHVSTAQELANTIGLTMWTEGHRVEHVVPDHRGGWMVVASFPSGSHHENRDHAKVAYPGAAVADPEEPST